MWDLFQNHIFGFLITLLISDKVFKDFAYCFIQIISYVDMELNFQGKRALVTGAGKGKKYKKVIMYIGVN